VVTIEIVSKIVLIEVAPTKFVFEDEMKPEPIVVLEVEFATITEEFEIFVLTVELPTKILLFVKLLVPKVIEPLVAVIEPTVNAFVIVALFPVIFAVTVRLLANVPFKLPSIERAEAIVASVLENEDIIPPPLFFEF
jgi:hypothetical protein